MDFSFDRAADRSATPAIKYDASFLKALFGRADVLPFWVADMEFGIPPFLAKAVERRMAGGNLGYEVYADSLRQAIVHWFGRRHAWEVDASHLVFTPNLISALNLLLKCLTEEGDGVIVQTPVYAPFFQTIKAIGRRPVYNSLKRVDCSSTVLESNPYTFDLSAFRQMALRPENKVLVLCSPHNPVGRVWRREELEELMRIAEEGDLFVISDEIHGDLFYPPHRHLPLLSLPFIKPDRVAILHSPAKTFNMAGVSRAFAVIPNKKLRRLFQKKLEALFLQHPGALAQVVMEAAYREGDAWVDALLVYLRENLRVVVDFFHREMPEVVVTPLEGTYLLWLDFSAWGIKGKEVNRRLAERGVGLNPGYWFGPEGEGFMRMNLACPREMLLEALERLK